MLRRRGGASGEGEFERPGGVYLVDADSHNASGYYRSGEDAPRDVAEIVAEHGQRSTEARGLLVWRNGSNALYWLLRALAAVGVFSEEPGRRFALTPLGECLRADAPQDRCEVVGDSFFERVREGGDAYVLKQIVHDWEDAQAAAILHVCRRAVGSGGRLLVIERELGAANERPEAKQMALQMLVSAGGRERTRDQYAALFAAAGFRLVGVTPTAGDLCIVEAAPA